MNAALAVERPRREFWRYGSPNQKKSRHFSDVSGRVNRRTYGKIADVFSVIDKAAIEDRMWTA